jgi:hypothetical protein
MPTSEDNPREEELGARRLWFGTATAAVSWILLGCVDIVITWRACMIQEDYGIPTPRPDVRFLYFAFALVFLGLSFIGGWVSYRNWRSLTGQREFLNSPAVERRAFMALGGLIVTATMGMGVLWLALPPLFLDICWRAR